MAIHIFRYRYTKEIIISVDDSKANNEEPEEVADFCLGSYFDLGLADDDEEGTVLLGGKETGIKADIVKKGSWDRII